MSATRLALSGPHKTRGVALNTLLAVGLIAAARAQPTAAAMTPAAFGRSPAVVARQAYAQLSPAERIGQLFMVGVPSAGPSSARLAMLRAANVGNLILTGDSRASRRTVAHRTADLRRVSTVAGVVPFVATDQEGGEVQRLAGTGFAPIPTALAQGAMPTDQLRAASTTWARELGRAGVTVNLAPVADTVPLPHAKANQPIGRYDREFAHTPGKVAAHVVAVVRGETAGGVAVTLKHFPGLGQATGNTDTKRGVTAPTTRHDPDLAPFSRGIAAGAPFVMVSSAAYPRIDGHRPACFSRTIISSMLRHDLKFAGVVVSDDFAAAALSRVPPAQQATRFFQAGGTMLLDTRAGPIASMERAVRTARKASAGFAATIKAAVMTVLTAKATAGLIA